MFKIYGADSQEIRMTELFQTNTDENIRDS